MKSLLSMDWRMYSVPPVGAPQTPTDPTQLPSSSQLAFPQKVTNGSCFMRKCKGHKIAKVKKNKAGRLTLPNFKTYD